MKILRFHSAIEYYFIIFKLCILDEDEKLALRMQMGYEPNFEDADEDEKAMWGGLKIIILVGLFIALFYGFIFFLLKQTGKGRKMKISFKTSY